MNYKFMSMRTPEARKKLARLKREGWKIKSKTYGAVWTLALLSVGLCKGKERKAT